MSLCFTFNCTMSSGSRKFCDYLRLLKFFFQRISNMLADCFNISPKKLGQLATIQPYSVCGDGMSLVPAKEGLYFSAL